MTKVKQLDFAGNTIFCGLDVHKASWRVNIRDTEMELKDFTQTADAFLLHKHLTKNYPGAKYKAGYEAGFCGFGIQRQLSASRPCWYAGQVKGVGVPTTKVQGEVKRLVLVVGKAH
jgi:hypothetical protein